MFAVGGGGSPVRCAGGCGLACLGFWDSALGLEDCLGDSPPYFSSNCCVELYLVAILSFSIVSSRCFCRSSRPRWAFEMR